LDEYFAMNRNKHCYSGECDEYKWFNLIVPL